MMELDGMLRANIIIIIIKRAHRHELLQNVSLHREHRVLFDPLVRRFAVSYLMIHQIVHTCDAVRLLLANKFHCDIHPSLCIAAHNPVKTLAA